MPRPLSGRPGETLRLPRTPKSFRVKFLAWLLPVWFCVTHYAGGIESTKEVQSKSLAQAATLFVMFAYCLWIGGRRFLEPPALRQPSTVLFYLMAATGVVSGSFSIDPVRSLLSWVSLLLAVYLCAGFWSVLGNSPGKTIGNYAIVASVSTFALYLAFNTGGRYAFYVNPNTWGLYCFGAAVTALLIDNWVLSFAMIGLSGFVATMAEARACMIAIGLSLFMYALFYLRRNAKATPLVTGIALFVFALAIVGGVVYFGDIWERVSSGLHLADKERGIGSGFTGRADAWGEAIAVFQKYPLIGIGPRLQDLYINFSGLKNAHNGYLVALIELGLFGFQMLMIWLAILVWQQFKAALRGNRMAEVGFCLWLGYAFIGIFDSRLINAGNPTSLLVWFFLLIPPAVALPKRVLRPSGLRYERSPIGSGIGTQLVPDSGRINLRGEAS
jgi:O-antigen ligase